MKKILLLAAIAASFSSVSAADFSDYFKLTYEGETVAPGQTITCGVYYDEFIMFYPELAGSWPSEYKSKALIFATNVSDADRRLEFRIQYVKPSAQEIGSYPNIGFGQVCFENENGEGSCLPNSFEFSSQSPVNPVAVNQYMKLDVEQVNFTDIETPMTLQVDLRVVEGSAELAAASVYVDFTHKTDITLAVDGIEAEATEAEYYNLQGVRVEQPQPGQLYIERKGGKATKRVF